MKFSPTDFILTAITLVVLDSIYLNIISSYFNQLITKVQGFPMKVEMQSAILAYIVLVCGIYYLIIMQKRSIVDAMITGWLVYLTYELTNKAIIGKWEWKAVLIDGIWGGILFGLTTYIVYTISKKIEE